MPVNLFWCISNPGFCLLGGKTPPPQYFQICQKVGQKSVMLEESWPQHFRDPLS